MKQVSLWTTAIVSALFVVIGCIDSQNWNLLGIYACAMAVWMMIGWFWTHRFDLNHDIKLLLKGESPLKCRWIGTLVFFFLLILIIIALIAGIIIYAAFQGLNHI